MKKSRVHRFYAKTKKFHRGFTLVELIIVIVIIGVLAAISIISYVNIKAKAQDAKVKDDLVLVRKAAQIYKASGNLLSDLKCKDPDIANPDIPCTSSITLADPAGSSAHVMNDNDVRQLKDGDGNILMNSAPVNPIPEKNYYWLSQSYSSVKRLLIIGETSTDGSTYYCSLFWENAFVGSRDRIVCNF